MSDDAAILARLRDVLAGFFNNPGLVVDVSTTARDAVIRISPMSGGSSKALRAEAIEIRQGGKALGARAIATADVAQEVDAVGTPMPAQAVSFRLANVSPGSFELAAEAAAG